MKRKMINITLLLGICVTTQAQQVTPAMRAAFDKLINERYQANEPGGTVLIAQKGKVLYQRGFGMADLELNVKMQPDMLFSIGSQTKQFTAVCILQLMEQGKLAVIDPIGKYIDACPDTWKAVTIENLMTHTSGIGDISNGRGMSVSALIDSAKKHPLVYTPGTRASYANIEYVLLGIIIEKISGETLGNYFRKHLLEPLGMSHTYFEDSNLIIPNRVPCYIKKSAGHFFNVWNDIAPSGAGALVSNTTDMMTWYYALAAGKVITKETLDKAWKPYALADGKPGRFGYGWMLGGTVQGSPIIEHSGLAVGYYTECFYMPVEQIFVAVLLNQRGYADPTAQELAAIFIGKPYVREALNLTPEQLQAYAGTYDERGNKRIIALRDGKLFFEPRGARRSQLIVCRNDHFYFDDTLVTGTIHRNAQGQVIALEIFDERYLSSQGTLWKKTETNETK